MYTALGSVCCRASSMKLLSGSLLMSCRPCDRCYSCQPVTVHWGHAVIDLDTTLNVWGKKAASGVRGGERIPSGCYRQTSGHHCCSTAVSVDSYKYWPFELSLLPPLDSLQLSYHYFTADQWFYLGKGVFISGPETVYCQRDPENFLKFIKWENKYPHDHLY